MSTRRLRPYLFFVLLVLVLAGIQMKSASPASDPPQVTTLITGRNVNMVSGTKLPWGDPWLQRQNEPSISVSTRNPLHLLAGANDYRTVDMLIPGERVPGAQIEAARAARDAWLGVYKSLDGGQSWVSTLLPGFPQDFSPNVLKEFTAAADPMVRSGTNGLFFYSGMAFNRVDRGNSAIFVARLVDKNDREISTQDVLRDPSFDPIEYIDTTIIDRGNAGQFLDMPYMAVGIPNSIAGSSVVRTATAIPVEIPFNRVYLAYSVFLGNSDINIRSQIRFIRSLDSGTTWSSPIKVSESQHIIQRPVIVPDPSNVNNIYIVFRRFKRLTAPDGIVFVRSTDGGQTFSKPVDIAVIEPFDQATTSTSFRTNSYPTMTVDAQGRLYAAWAQRVGGAAGYARIFMKTSADRGMTWTGSSTEVTGEANARGHQFKPVLSFSAGKITLGWWDQRNDQTELFTPWIDDANIPLTDPRYRHTIDVRVAQADPGAGPVFGTSKRVSRYLYVFDTDAFGKPKTKEVGGTLYYAVKQAQWNPPNLPMFQDGKVPFHGDWVDLAPSPAFLPDGTGGWRFNTGMDGVAAASINSPRPQFPNVHFTWTDNRDVRWPLNISGKPDLWGDWTKYTPLNDLGQNGLYTHVQSPPCTTGDQTGMRNQNVYTSTLSKGLIVGSLGNTKPLNSLGFVSDNPSGIKIPRAFAVSVKNETNASRTFVLTFEKSDEWVDASFAQFEPLGALTLRIDAHSTVSVPVYLKLTGTAAQDGTLYETVKVHVEETQALDPSNPLYGVVILNLDHRNPPIQDTPLLFEEHIDDEEVYNPFIDISKFNVETYNVSADWSVSPAFENPEDMNSDTINPNIRSDGSANPNIRSGAANPNIRSPNIRSPNIRSMSVTDASWETENQGNTTATYFFNMNTDYEKPDPNIVPSDQAVEFQLLIYKVYYTPAAEGCLVGTEEHQELVANIANPNIRSPNIRSPNIRSSNLASSALSAMRVQEEILDGATVALAPGEKARFILRATDPNPANSDVFNPGTSASPKIYAAVSSFAANTEDAIGGNLTPPVATTFPPGQEFLTITTSSLNDGFVGQGYFETLQAFGTPPFTWSINNSDLPPGLTQANGVISGTPRFGHVTYPQTYQFLVTVTDSASAIASKTLSIIVNRLPIVSTKALFGVDSSLDGLSVIDPVTGNARFIGELDPDPDRFVTPIAMAVRPYDRKILVWNNSKYANLDSGRSLINTGELLEVNTGTGRATRADVNAAPQGSFQALSYGPNRKLYLLDSEVYEVDEWTGIKGTIPVAQGFGYRILGADLGPDGFIYGLASTGVENPVQYLLKVDVVNPSVTVVASLSQDVGYPNSLVFDPAGKLIGSSANGILFDIDRSNGIVTNIRQISGGSTPQGMAFVPTDLFLTTLCLPSGLVNSQYQVTLATKGGIGPLTWSSGGGLPAWVTLSGDGILSGTPPASGTQTVTIQVSDSSTPPQLQSLNFTLEVLDPLTSFTPPLQLSPCDGAVFDHWPRTTTVEWTPVPGAASYTVEIAYSDGTWHSSLTAGITGPSHTFEFVGAQPGRWRVKAVNPNGGETLYSPWRGFRYLR